MRNSNRKQRARVLSLVCMASLLAMAPAFAASVEEPVPTEEGDLGFTSLRSADRDLAANLHAAIDNTAVEIYHQTGDETVCPDCCTDCCTPLPGGIALSLSQIV